jgi:hypothetical protein
MTNCAHARRGGAADNIRPMQLLVFTALGLVAFLIAYAFGLGGAVSALIFLTILFTGALIRVFRPLIEMLKP